MTSTCRPTRQPSCQPYQLPAGAVLPQKHIVPNYMLLALKYKEVFWQQVTLLMVCIGCYFSHFAFLNTHQPPQCLPLQKATGDCPRLLFSPLTYGLEDVKVAPVGSLSPVEMAGGGPALGPVFKALPPSSDAASTTVMTPSSGGAGRTQDFCPGQPCALIPVILGSPKGPGEPPTPGAVPHHCSGRLLPLACCSLGLCYPGLGSRQLIRTPQAWKAVGLHSGVL